MKKGESLSDFNRREFLKSSSLAALMAMMDGVKLQAEEAKPGAGTALTKIPTGPPVKYGIIGLGDWGRETLKTLAALPNAPVTAICDTYGPSLRRAGGDAPTAEKFEDYHALLESKEVEAVVVTTPTHQHKQIVLDALAAGKHVYCEAPLAGSIEDAREIAKAAKAAVKVVFQAGLQERSHPERAFLVPFIRSGALGKNAFARAQWHKRDSWRRASSNAEHEKALNWRLDAATSTGLIGEAGIHQLDAAGWFLKARPTAVTGFSSTILWTDGRTTPDTVQAVVEYGEGTRLIYDATLCSSFDAALEVYHGTDATLMTRDQKGWLFKEAEAPLLGWEVYARKDSFYTELGIVLTANATKQASLGTKQTAGAFADTPAHYALQAFTENVGKYSKDVADFIESYGDGDLAAMAEALAHSKVYPAAGWREGLEATIVAIKANEAAAGNRRVEIDKGLFEL